MKDRTLRASQATPAARAWLSRQRPGRVLHAFPDVCNLINDENSVLSLQTAQIPPAPNCLVLLAANWPEGGFANYVQAGDPIRHVPGQLHVADLRIDWRQADEWDPKPPWESLRRTRDKWMAALPRLRQLALSESPAGGIAALLDPSRAPSGGTSLADGFVNAARPHATALLHGLARADRGSIREAAAGLAGLGSGLTPSGDDYLVGVMHALWCSEAEGSALTLSRAIAQSAAPRTTPLSAEWLRAAARGEAAAYWHDLLASVRAGDANAVDRSARLLLRVGHSSGSDALTGFLDVLLH